VTADPADRPNNREAARLLQEMAASPRQAIIWPSYHGGWASNTAAAMTAGIAALEAEGSSTAASRLAEVRDGVGDAVGYVIEAKRWPTGVDLAMRLAADALVPTVGATV
jgi:hypothetical protein